MRFFKLIHVQFPIFVQVIFLNDGLDLVHGLVLFGQLQLAFGNISILIFINGLKVTMYSFLYIHRDEGGT